MRSAGMRVSEDSALTFASPEDEAEPAHFPDDETRCPFRRDRCWMAGIPSMTTKERDFYAYRFFSAASLEHATQKQPRWDHVLFVGDAFSAIFKMHKNVSFCVFLNRCIFRFIFRPLF